MRFWYELLIPFPFHWKLREFYISFRVPDFSFLWLGLVSLPLESSEYYWFPFIFVLFCSRSFCTNTVTLLCKTSIFKLYSASDLIQSTLIMRFLASILLSDVCVPPGRTPLVTIRHCLSYYLCDFMTSLCLSRRRQWHPTPVLLPGKCHGQRSLLGYSPWGRRESDTTNWLHFHFQTVAHQAPPSMEFPRQEYWSGLPCPPPGNLPDSELNLHLLCCRQILYPLSHLGSPPELVCCC